MKKLAIIGIAVLGLTLTIAVSQAGAYPGLSKSEARALMLRSEGLNQQYGLDVAFRSENPYARGRVAPLVDQGKPTAGTRAGYRALLLRSEGLNQKYGIVPVKSGIVQVKSENPFARGPVSVPTTFASVRSENPFARGLPVSVPTTFGSAPSTSTEFQWGDAVIGAGALLGLMALVAGLLGLGRHRFRLGTS